MKKIAVLIPIILICTIFAGCGHEHTMSEKIIKEKTCTTDGEIEHYCTECNYSYIETVEASHDYEKEIIVESTCTQKGEAKFTCKACGDSYVTELSLAPHNYKDKYCTVCGAKKIGKITTPFTPISLDYCAGKTVRTTCKITNVTAEINSYGAMTVYFDGVKTYDISGETTNGPCSFMMIIYDASGEIIYSDQVMTHCIVNQTFKIYTNPTGLFDESEDYKIELKDYMM